MPEKREMNYRGRWSAAVIGALAVALSVTYLSSWIFGVILAVVVLLLAPGIFTVPEKNYGMIERFGRFHNKRPPGLRLIILPGIMDTLKAMVFFEQREIELFTKGVTVDFRDGSAEPKGAVAFVEIEKPKQGYLTEEEEESEAESKKRNGVYRSVYHIEDVDRAVRDRVENAVRSYLNKLTIDEGLAMARANYNILNSMERDTQEDEGAKRAKEETEELREAFKDYGIRLVAVIIEDFKLDPTTVKYREEVHRREKEEEAAGMVAKRRAKETIGTIIEMMAQSRGVPPEEIREEIKEDEKLQKEFLTQSFDLIDRRMGIDGKAFLDIRTSSGEIEGCDGGNFLDQIKKMFLDLIAAKERMPQGKSKGKGGGKYMTKEQVEEFLRR